MANPTVSAGNSPDAVAVSPDGRSVYVANSESDDVSQFTVGAGGALTPMAAPNVPAGDVPGELAVSPDGRSVYVTNYFGGISQFTVGAGGALAPMAAPIVVDGQNPEAIIVSPNGGNVYVANFGTDGADGVSQYTVGAGGALTSMGTSTVATNGGPITIAVSPDSHSAYVVYFGPNYADGIAQYDAGPSGALTPKTPTTVTSTEIPFEIAITPDQAAVASFATTSALGSPVSFDGSASTASNGTIASYAWNFGDGSTQTTTTPHVTHLYAHLGTYTTTLTVTDRAGCSTTVISTGQTASCNGGPTAQTTRQVTVGAATKAATTIKPAPQVQVPSLAGVGLLHVSATLTSSNTPLAGKTVAFTVGKTKLCSSETNTQGAAGCQLNVLQEVVVLLNNSYTASFSGDSGYTASMASTPAISCSLMHGQARTSRGHVAHHLQSALLALAHAHGHHAAQLRARVKQILNHKQHSIRNTAGPPAAHPRPGHTPADTHAGAALTQRRSNGDGGKSRSK